MSENEKGRVVVIVGRPNVGKSALFNALLGRRAAIVHAESGVTRDRLMREVAWGEERFELIDTGGLCNVDGARGRDVIETGILSQVEAALGDAAAAIFVVDLEAGLLPMDEEVARLLRTGSCRVVVAANKADSPERDGLADEFTALGFPVYPVSALHKRGFEPMVEDVIAALPPAANPTLAEPLRVAVVGRPNVGKSSFINRLLRAERVLVSDIPGTTRDSVDVPFTVGQGEQARHYVLIDTAGLRKQRKIRSRVEQVSVVQAQRSIRDANVVLLVLDAVEGPSLRDKKIAASVLEQGKGLVVIVNKWDLATVTQRAYAPAVVREMPFVSICPIVFVSSRTGYNIRRSVDAIDHVGAQIRMELPTGVLNRTLSDAQAQVHPPAVKGKRLRIFYATQVGCEPIRIRLFVNDPRCVTPPYREYLVKSLRRRFGLEGAPLVLLFSPRPRRDVG